MTINYNVQHSPVGAFSSFTIGHFGTKGGPATQVGKPGNCNVYIGYQYLGKSLKVFPFYEGAADRRSDFEVEAHSEQKDASPKMEAIAESEITRELNWASDSWTSGPISLCLWSPFQTIPDPKFAASSELQFASCPVVFATLKLDNHGGKHKLRSIFSLDGQSIRDISQTAPGSLVGIAHRGQWGIAAKSESGARAFMEFRPQDALKGDTPRVFRLGQCGGLVMEAEPGTSQEWTIVVGFYNPGIVTTGVEASYWYSRYFNSLESVLDYGLANWPRYKAVAVARDTELKKANLNDHQKFLIAHSSHSYYGSTEWLDRNGKALWVVNEGEYEMINTFDLTVDQLFYEMKFSPWTVRNELEFFVERYAYYDQIHAPGQESELRRGGISFCHDQGVSNQFTAFSHSSYETPELPALCFSYMTHEQLTNWVCCAGVYLAKTKDLDFLSRNRGILFDCLQSLLNRDDPNPELRNGVMAWDSSRCGQGAEITTYDSLDASLGQARNNLYLAGKSWASYVILADLFKQLGEADNATISQAAALRCADTICSKWDKQLGYIPAVFEQGNQSAIIPAIEGLVYPHQAGLSEALDFNGIYGKYLNCLKQHFMAVFKPGLCLFADKGWKLSSTSNNSWMSKIAISQFVARQILGINFGEEQIQHDLAHERWQKIGSAYWACCDQIVSGEAKGSRYYPRIVTSILWLEE